MATARCMRCKENVLISEEKQVKTKNNRTALTGFCPKCRTKLFKIIG